jgi:hypothetical protein
VNTSPLSTLMILVLALLPARTALAQDEVEEGDEGGEDRRYETPDEDYYIPLEDGESGPERTEQVVLFIPLLSLDRESAAASRDLSRVLIDGLAERPHLDLYRLSDVPAIYDGDKRVEASLYMRGCPPDQELGCQLILGEKADVDRVVSGTYQQDVDTTFVVITVLNVPLAELEYSFEVRLESGQEASLLEAVELTLEELADPFDDNVAVDESGLEERELEKRRAAKERMATRALDLALTDSVFEELAASRKVDRGQITEEDLQEQVDSELITTDWEDAGLSKAQYVRWHNSRLSLEAWKERAANHRFQPILGLSLGYLTGPVELDFYGNWILDPENLQNVVDGKSMFQQRRGAGLWLNALLGFGLTTFLDFEFNWSMAFSNLNIQLQKYEYAEDDPDTIQPYFNPIVEQPQIFVYGLAWKVRFYPAALWRIKPTVAAGFGLMVYPDIAELYDFQCPCYAPESAFIDPLLILEPGVVIELSRHVAITADLPFQFSLEPTATRTAHRDPYESTALDSVVEMPDLAPPVYFGFKVGVQVRLFRPRFPSSGKRSW